MTTATPSLLQASEAHGLIAQAAEAAQAVKAWEAHLKGLKEQLLALHAASVPSEFIEAGFAFKLQQGRTSVVLDNEVKAQIAELQQAALAEGRAIKKQGQPFWSLKKETPMMDPLPQERGAHLRPQGACLRQGRRQAGRQEELSRKLLPPAPLRMPRSAAPGISPPHRWSGWRT